MVIWQAICKRVEGLECKNMYYKYAEMHRAVNLKKPRINKKARMLWALRNAEENGEDDPSGERHN